MRKKLVAIVMTAAMVTAVGGCGKKDNKENKASNGNATEAPAATDDAAATEAPAEVTDVALKVWCPQNQVDTKIMEQQQQAFAEAHPEWNITWTTEIVGEDVCKTEVLKDVEAAGDVFFFAADQLTELVDAGAIAQLGGSAEQMVKDTVADSVRATVTIGDATYGIPFTHNTFFMYYDKSLLDENDIKSLEGIMAKETADDVYNFYFQSAGGWQLG